MVSPVKQRNGSFRHKSGGVGSAFSGRGRITMALAVAALLGFLVLLRRRGGQGKEDEEIFSSFLRQRGLAPPHDRGGWKTIHVFAGSDDKHLEVGRDYGSQVKQDVTVAGLLKGKRSGYFVDLAANDATFLSNTYRLERDYNWTGLCIEPNPDYWKRLTYRKCDTVAAVIGAATGDEVDFRLRHGKRFGGYGGIERADFDNRPETNAKKLGPPTKFYTVTIRDVFTRMNSPIVIDYLSLDIEGAEYFVMEHFPFDQYRICLMTVERPSEQLQGLLKREGYTFLCELSEWGETVWAHETDKSSLDLTVLPANCAPGKPGSKLTKTVWEHSTNR